MNQKNADVLNLLGPLLVFVFVPLKLEHIVEWNWFWVMSPLIFLNGLGLLLNLLTRE